MSVPIKITGVRDRQVVMAEIHTHRHTHNLQTMNINTDVTLMSPQNLDSSKTRETAENRHVRLTFK